VNDLASVNAMQARSVKAMVFLVFILSPFFAPPHDFGMYNVTNAKHHGDHKQNCGYHESIYHVCKFS
jgi:hypothetical protein